MFGFEKLEVWQKAIEFADEVYKLTASFPSEERYGLASQLRRAAVSISANIAEGAGRGTSRDFSHFLNMAYGSVNESVSLLEVSKRLGYMPEDGRARLYSNLDVIARMLSGLRGSLDVSH